jgi:hypothetical protein
MLRPRATIHPAAQGAKQMKEVEKKDHGAIPGGLVPTGPNDTGGCTLPPFEVPEYPTNPVGPIVPLIEHLQS